MTFFCNENENFIISICRLFISKLYFCIVRAKRENQMNKDEGDPHPFLWYTVFGWGFRPYAVRKGLYAVRNSLKVGTRHVNYIKEKGNNRKRGNHKIPTYFVII